MRIVIELKRDAIPRVVLNQLYKHTTMQATFGVINLALEPDSNTGQRGPQGKPATELREHHSARRPRADARPTPHTRGAHPRGTNSCCWTIAPTR